MRPPRTIEERQKPAILLPKLLNIVQGAAARVTKLEPGYLDIGRCWHRLVQLQNERLSQVRMGFPNMFQHNAFLLTVKENPKPFRN